MGRVGRIGRLDVGSRAIMSPLGGSDVSSVEVELVFWDCKRKDEGQLELDGGCVSMRGTEGKLWRPLECECVAELVERSEVLDLGRPDS